MKNKLLKAKKIQIQLEIENLAELQTILRAAKKYKKKKTEVETRKQIKLQKQYIDILRKALSLPIRIVPTRKE